MGSLKRIVEDVNPDIIHAHNISSFCHSPQVLSKKYKIPLVVTVHDYWLISPDRNNPFPTNTGVIPMLPYVNELSFPIFQKRVKRGMNLLSSLAPNAKLVAVSDYVRNVLENYFSPDILCTILNGIDLPEIEKNYKTTDLEKRANLDENGSFFFLFTGGFSFLKGFRDVMKISNILINDKRCRFVVTGTKKSISNYYLFNSLRPRISSQGTLCRGNVEFFGRLEKSVFLDYLKNSYCLLFPSRWPEPCPITVLEAMALGKPVVAYDVGGLPELVINGKTGFLVKDGDHKAVSQILLYLLDNPSEVKKIGKNCKEHVQKFFTSERMYDQYERLYSSFI
jgi:glycosyltransferase involved in cell wall biosynthesis